MLVRGLKASIALRAIGKENCYASILSRYDFLGSLTLRNYGVYTPERINQARKEMQRLRRLDQYGEKWCDL